MTRENEPTASEALAHARDAINEAREALMRADGHRQAQYARSAIDSATTILVHPGATPREVIAAHSFLREALALDGRPNTCGAESIDTVREASTLPPEDQKWLQNYLESRRPPTQQSSATGDLGITPGAKITWPWRLESGWRSQTRTHRATVVSTTATVTG